MALMKWGPAVATDDVWRRLFRNLAYLGSANAIVAFASIITLAMVARALGPFALGILALIEAYVRSVDQLVRIEPWQGVIRYGTSALEGDRRKDFEQLVKFSTLCDIVGGIVAALVAIGVAKFAANWLNFDGEQLSMVIWFSATLALGLSSTPTAILRLFDKFDVLAKISVATALGRLVLTFVAWQAGSSLWTFVVLLMAYQVVEQTLPLVFAWRELYRRGHRGIWRQPLRGVVASHPRIIQFIINANVNVVARTSVQRFDILIVGALLGPSAAGLYHLARRVGLVALRVGRPLQQAVYPDIARLWARGQVQRFRKVVLRVNVTLAAAAGLGLAAVAFFMEDLVRLVFGEAFATAAPLMIVQVFAVTIFLGGITLNPALLSMGEDRTLVRITLTATAVFFAALFPLIDRFGALGGCFAHVIFNAVWLAGCLTVFLRRTGADQSSSLNTQASSNGG